MLPRELHKEWHQGDVRGIAIGQDAPGKPLTVTGTVVGRDDNQRIIVHILFPETVHEPSEEAVDKTHLEQMSLIQRVN